MVDTSFGNEYYKPQANVNVVDNLHEVSDESNIFAFVSPMQRGPASQGGHRHRLSPVSPVWFQSGRGASSWFDQDSFASVANGRLREKQMLANKGMGEQMKKSTSDLVEWPITLWLVAAFVSFLLSVSVWFFVDQLTGLFVATWVPSILAFGALVRRRQ